MTHLFDAMRPFTHRDPGIAVFDERIVVLLCDVPPIRVRDAALDASCGASWADLRLHGLRCVQLSACTGVVRYSIAATVSALPYSAQVSSVYVRQPGGWKLTFPTAHPPQGRAVAASA